MWQTPKIISLTRFGTTSTAEKTRIRTSTLSAHNDTPAHKAGLFFFVLICYGGVMVVRMRHTRSQTGNRRSHHALTSRALAVCECGAPRVSHRACPSCGRYRGRVVVDLAKKAQARAAKRTKREGDKTEAQK